ASVHHEESRRPALPWAPRQSACAAEPRQYKREGIVRPALRFTRPASLDGVGSSGRTHATRCAGCARAHGAQASLVAMGILFLMLAALFLLPMLRLCSRFLAGGFSRGLMIDTSLVMLGSRHRPGSHQHPGKNKTDHLFHEVSPLLGAAKAARYTALLSAATRPSRPGLRGSACLSQFQSRSSPSVGRRLCSISVSLPPWRNSASEESAGSYFLLGSSVRCSASPVG